MKRVRLVIEVDEDTTAQDIVDWIVIDGYEVLSIDLS